MLQKLRVRIQPVPNLQLPLTPPRLHPHLTLLRHLRARILLAQKPHLTLLLQLVVRILHPQLTAAPQKLVVRILHPQLTAAPQQLVHILLARNLQHIRAHLLAHILVHLTVLRPLLARILHPQLTAAPQQLVHILLARNLQLTRAHLLAHILLLHLTAHPQPPPIALRLPLPTQLQLHPLTALTVLRQHLPIAPLPLTVLRQHQLTVPTALRLHQLTVPTALRLHQLTVPTALRLHQLTAQALTNQQPQLVTLLIVQLLHQVTLLIVQQLLLLIVPILQPQPIAPILLRPHIIHLHTLLATLLHIRLLPTQPPTNLPRRTLRHIRQLILRPTRLLMSLARAIHLLTCLPTAQPTPTLMLIRPPTQLVIIQPQQPIDRAQFQLLRSTLLVVLKQPRLHTYHKQERRHYLLVPAQPTPTHTHIT
jgi:hypothetical protein